MDMQTQLALSNEATAVRLGLIALEDVPENHRLAVEVLCAVYDGSLG